MKLHHLLFHNKNKIETQSCHVESRCQFPVFKKHHRHDGNITVYKMDTNYNVLYSQLETTQKCLLY